MRDNQYEYGLRGRPGHLYCGLSGELRSEQHLQQLDWRLGPEPRTGPESGIPDCCGQWADLCSGVKRGPSPRLSLVHADCNRGVRRRLSYADSYRYSDTDSQHYCNSYAYRHTNSNSYAYGNCHGYAHSDIYSQADADPEISADAKAAPDATPSTITAQCLKARIRRIILDKLTLLN